VNQLRSRPIHLISLDPVARHMISEAISEISSTIGTEVVFEEIHFEYPGAPQKRFRGDVLIDLFARRHDGCSPTVLLTSREIYVPPYMYVLGFSKPRSGIGMVSWSRFRGNPDLAELVAKEVIHEFGHLAGLTHCSSGKCVMAFSGSLDELRGKGICFCRDCESKLAMKHRKVEVDDSSPPSRLG
jgi:predicted Zn-dependent protease